MKVTRLYTGTDGESHFEDIDIPLSDTDITDRRSETIKATGITFRETSGEYDVDWHTAANRQFMINLDGQVEIIIGDGTKRRIGPGEILLAEDTTGRGHISRAIENQPRKSIFVILD
jgi:hypothetical protein